MTNSVVALEISPMSLACRCALFQSRFSNPGRNPFLGWNPPPRIIENFLFSDVVLDGEFRGLLNASGFVEGTGYLSPNDLLQGLQIDPGRVVSVQYVGRVIICCNQAHMNYFHWCSQSLPAIDSAIRRAGQDQRIILALPQLNGWQEESLRLLGYGSLPRLTIADPKKQYALPEVEFSQILVGGAAFVLSETLYRTFIRLRQAVEKLPGPPRKLYVARADANHRVMRNEAEIIEYVQQIGYDVVIPGLLSFNEQIRLFRSASIVIGPHGAGMTNIIFCEPHTVVYELIPIEYANSCFCNLAMVCRLNYWADVFSSEGDLDMPPFLRDWESDTQAVAERLREIDFITASMQAGQGRGNWPNSGSGISGIRT